MDPRAARVQLFVFYLSKGLVRILRIELSHMGKNNGPQSGVRENVFLSLKIVLDHDEMLHNDCIMRPIMQKTL